MASLFRATCRHGARKCSCRSEYQTNKAVMNTNRNIRASVMKMTGITLFQADAGISDSIGDISQDQADDI